MPDPTTDRPNERPIGPTTESWQIARIVGTEEEAALIAGFLQANDVPAEVESLLASEMPLIGELSEVRIRVPAERLAEAQELLAASDAQPAAAPEADSASPANEPE